jgi:NAD(P)-dependent dehydrogenase (short-subunit alcohol dehydrogenase family)
MKELAGKVGFVTGGASGIGLALGRAMLEAGMKVALADIEPRALEGAVRSLGNLGEVRGIRCDVSDRAAMKRAADEAFGTFGRVHLLCNNAGVAVGGIQDQVSYEDWDWVLGVNLLAAVSGIREFLPRMRAQGEGGHIVNTASMAGMISPPHLSPYSATKFAVVAMSEALAGELQGTGIGVSVLCPGWVKTRINESGRNRPTKFGGAGEANLGGNQTELRKTINAAIEGGMDPAEVARRTLAAVRDNRLYVFTHPQMRPAVEDRFKRILEAFDEAERS